jgi:asparaginyl-tRNA synthetase
MAIIKFRYELIEIIRQWFRKEGFVEIHAPILTQLPLYDDDTLFSLNFFGQKVFLTQCVAFYLESAVHAFERVYSISPSFRAEKSKGRKHLAEFWHVKAEIAFADLEEIINFVENMLSYVIRKIWVEAKELMEILEIRTDLSILTKIPYPRITYSDALIRLRAMGIEREWGRSLTDNDLSSLSKTFDTPFWITGNPRNIEPFPYKIDPANTHIVKVADLIAPDGFGELCGVAEKIWKIHELDERMKEKGKDTDKRYEWYRELRQFGSVPHSGFGIGIERMIRWLLRLNHVRDAIPFPRLFGRMPNP